MRKFEVFFNKIATLRSDLRGENGMTAKVIIGASIDNHRTLSVNQTIQYLLAIRKVKLAKQLETIYPVLKPEIVSKRLDLTKRSDAIDIAEFVDTYRHLVMNNKLYRRTVATQLRKVA